MAKIRATILIIILVLISLLLVRFVMEFSQNENVSLIRTILLLPSEPLAAIFRSVKIGSIEVSTIIAIIFLIIFGYLSSKVTAAFEKKVDEDTAGTELIEVVLRAVEFLIIFRVLLSFIGASGQNSVFTGLVYLLTDWSGILLNPLNLSFGRLDISALIMLLLIIVLDINTEIILRALKVVKNGGEKSAEFVSRSSQRLSGKSVNDSDTIDTNDLAPVEQFEHTTETSTSQENTVSSNTEPALTKDQILEQNPALRPTPLPEVKQEDQQTVQQSTQDAGSSTLDASKIDVRVNEQEQTVTIKLPVVEDPANPATTNINTQPSTGLTTPNQQSNQTKLPKTKHIDDKAVPEG